MLAELRGPIVCSQGTILQNVSKNGLPIRLTEAPEDLVWPASGILMEDYLIGTRESNTGGFVEQRRDLTENLTAGPSQTRLER